MYPTDHLYASFIEISLFIGLIYVAGLFLLFLLVLFRKLTLRRFIGYAGSIFLTFVMMLGVVGFQYHNSLTEEPITVEAVYMSGEHEGSLIPFTHAFDDTLYHFYSIEDEEAFAAGVLDKRAELVKGTTDFKEANIYQLTCYDEPVLELLEVKDTGKTVNDVDSADNMEVYSQKFDEDGSYEEFDILYYGNESHLLKAWIEEERYYKKDGWQKSDFLTVEEIYPGIGKYDYLNAEFIERNDYYLLRFVATGLERVSHMEALNEIGYIEFGDIDGELCYAPDWIEDLKDQGFAAVPKTKWEALELTALVAEANSGKSQDPSAKQNVSAASESEKTTRESRNTTGSTRYIKHRFAQEI